MTFRILFSDLDGTCIHYPSLEALNEASVDADGYLELCNANGNTASVLRLPPSSSGSIGIISVKTLELYAAIRALGIKLVFITGARFSTLAQRLPYLPAADAYICESGGRIFLNDTKLPTAAHLREDFLWRNVHEKATGPCFQDSLKPEERSGDLWKFYCQLVSLGKSIDAASYTTAFRVREPLSKRAAIDEGLPSSLSIAVNLGAVDVYPATSGKANAARYMMAKYGFDTNGSSSIFMCDDDNDLELAAAVQKAYLPSITAHSVAQAVKDNPSQFHVSTKEGIWATEDILETILNQAIESHDQ